MIERERLRDGMVDGFVVFDKWGNIVTDRSMSSAASPALIVDDVTDALKTVVGEEVGESVDRSQTWRVVAMVLDGDAVDRLPEAEMTVEEVLEAVRSMGLEWTVSPISSP